VEAMDRLGDCLVIEDPDEKKCMLRVTQIAEANLSEDGVMEGNGQHKQQNA
jgi:hypothetical protein